MKKIINPWVLFALAVTMSVMFMTSVSAQNDNEQDVQKKERMQIKTREDGKKAPDLMAKTWPEDDGTRLRQLEASDIGRLQIFRLDPPRGVRRGPEHDQRKHYTTGPLTHDEHTAEIKALLALVQRAPLAKPIPPDIPLEPAFRDRCLVVQPVNGDPFEIYYAPGFDEPFGSFHSIELKEALFALESGAPGISIIHFDKDEVLRVIHHWAIAPHEGGVYSQTVISEIHLTPEKGLTFYLRVHDGKKILMEDEKAVHYGEAKFFTSEGPGKYVVLLHRP